MKKFLLFLVALTAFAACDDDPIDYSTWTEEELLASPGGLDYLVKQSGAVDYAYIEEQLETKVFDPTTFYVLDKHGWTDSSEWYGYISSTSYFILDGSTIRCCSIVYNNAYLDPDGNRTNRYYIDRQFTGDRLSAVLKAFRQNSRIAAQIEDTLIVEYRDEYNRLWRHVVYLTDTRDILLQKYPYSFDELTY